MKRHPSPTVLENGIYALIWLIVALIPLFGYYDAAEGIHWKEVIRFWQRVVPFFVLFLVNNYLLTRYFLTRKRSGLYVVVMLAFVIVLFVVAPALFGRQTPRPILRFV